MQTWISAELCPLFVSFPGCHWMADDVVPEQATAALRMHMGESGNEAYCS